MRDRAYLLAVKGLPCALKGAFVIDAEAGTITWYRCDGAVEADHQGERPKGRKADDDTAVPMCQQHHLERTNYCGWFARFNATSMRAWCDQRIAETREKLKDNERRSR